MDSSDKKAAFISIAIREGKEVSLIQLFDIFGLSRDTYILDNIAAISTELGLWNLIILPDLSQGDLYNTRLIKSKNPIIVSQNQIDIDIQSYEGSHIEFKGSLLFDINKHKFNQDLIFKQYRSENVLYESLKTIAAFLNCGGGVLYIGINDDGSIQGLQNDCMVLGYEDFNQDIFQLELRNQISGKFKDGKTINDYIDVVFFKKENFPFARVNVAKRNKLSFVIRDNTNILFKRQGNRTTEVKIEEMEEFIYHRIDQGWSHNSYQERFVNLS
jgi:hypothetical protein